jgi:predicted  nucleic acid-binding Zn-ribbon protein
MSYDNDQNEYPISDDRNKSDKFIPRYFRTLPNKKFLSATVDQLIQQGSAEKLNSYYGTTAARAYTPKDNYVTESNKLRNDYQFSPATISVDDLGNTNFYKDYIDYINQINNLKGTVTNHNNLNEQEYYALDPHIDFDKFSNYREYYWLAYGPQTVDIAGNSIDNVSTYTITRKDNVDNFSYVFNPNGFTSNPDLRILRGQTYVFEIDAPGMPMQIRTQRPGTEEFEYTEGVTNIFNEDGTQTLTWKVPITAPDVLYYVDENDINQSGVFKILDVEDAAEINVEEEVIGKKTYTSGNGIALSNGMKIRFAGVVYPEKYASGEWYVEGVGNKIQLIPEEELYIPTTYNEDKTVPFDSEYFDRLPFDDASGFAGIKDYIVINRASQDKSYWSRSNKWFHRSVIETSAKANNEVPIIDDSLRAKKPIIEFEANLKLSNFGTITKTDVDLVDNITKDVFSTIEGKASYNIDGVDIVPGMRILFTADTDVLVKNKIYEVKQIRFINNNQLTLQETEDSDPITNETVLVKNGTTFQGKMLYFNGSNWLEAQYKNTVNQEPFFELFTQEGISTQTLQSVSQIGTNLLSYKRGTGVNDPELGFPISYRSIENIGDIEFNLNLLSDTIEYTELNVKKIIAGDQLLIKKYNGIDTFEYINAYTKAPHLSRQPVLKQTIAYNTQTVFPIDMYENSASIDDLWVRVYVNNQITTDYDITNINGVANVVLKTPSQDKDIVLIKTHSASPKNNNGYYDLPINLSNNPDNINITGFTFGEMGDHVQTIVEEIQYIDGVFPGISNLRDQGLVAKHGKRFVQHSSPINLSNFHLNDETANIITAIEYNKREYSKFKREFLDVANTLGFDGDVKTHVDKVLEKINKNKNNSMPFYFSDMMAYGLCYSVDHSVFDTNNRFYPLNTKFDLSELSIRSVNVYHNGIQIAYNRDYMFNSEGFVVLSDQYEVAYDDIITICEYSNTDGSYIPPTPTKLGLYPAYVPEIYIDETYLEPQTVIQGHDGSIRIGYNDFRDHLLLELEMRIYNNIKVAYDENIFDINSYVGGEFRKTKFTHQQIDNAYIDDFIDWLNFVGNPDYTDNDFYTSANPFTFNYFASTTPSDKPLLGFWRGIYKDAFDTDRPHTHPWEILGFSIKPAWWNKVYGPAPYTSDNIPMWKDLESGFVREPGKPLIVRSKYARPGLASFPPATSQGKIQNPLNSGYIKNFSNAAIKTKYKFGDMAPVEAAWRKSSDYPFALLKSMIINRPAHVFGLGFDRSRISRNFAGQLVYGDTNKRITLNSIQFPNSKDDAQRIQTAGLVNFIANLIYSSVNTSYAQYQTTLKGLQNKLGLRVGGYTNKEKFNLLLDSRTPLNAGNVFVPQENYNIHLNKSTAVEIVTYSGVIIEKTQAGYVVRGYDRFNPVFTINKAIPSSKDSVISQGGTSENFVEWGEGKTYLQGNLVRYEGRFYRARVEHVSGESFDATLYVGITEVPVVGGVSATIASNFSPHPSYVDYGTTFQTIQEIISFLAGYEHYLKKSGFIFESFNPEIETVQNWRMSMKDFLFWTTQNWQENSVITLSPAAETLKFYREDYIVDNIFNTLYSTAPLNSNGKLINPANLTYSRVQKEFILQPRNTPEGIYLAKLPLTQKEHVITIDNQTIFQDVIYNPGPGYKQERIKVLGYRSADWDGSTNVPGFIVDDPVIYEWEANTDYAIGDIIKYKEFYYVAKSYVAGTSEFNLNFWAILEDKPEAGMMPNLEYKVNQFADFYDLDTDNFDVEQQKLAQHLIGYQKRNYLQNILKDDVSQYKFYQGYIKEKGSKNALTKLFDSLASSTDSLEFYEEWAFNAGTYGAIDGIREIEFILDESKFQLSPQPIKLVNTVGKDNLDLIYRQPISDVYLSDEFYSPDTAFPIFDNIPKDIIKTAGYVHSDDVKLELANYTELANVDATTLENNDYIWIGKNANNTWDVLKVENTNLTPTLNEDGTQTRLDFEYAHGLAVNDIFIIATEDSTEFLRTVRKIENNKVFVDRINTLEVGILPIRKFVSHRFDTLTNVAEKMDMSLAEATIWVDNVNDKWTVYKKSINNYKEVWNFENNEKSDWLTDYDVNQRNNIAVVGVPSDTTVEVYARGTDSIAMELEGKIIEESGLATNTGFGKAVAISADSKYIAVGSPDATNIKTDLIGDWDNTTAFAGNSIVKHNDAYWRANVDTLPEVSSQNYSSFAAHPIVKDNLGDSTEPNLLLAGNYPKDNTLADHFLIRATAEEYKAVFVGSTISLTWNRYSVSHVNPLLAREPFENTVAGLDSTFLNGEHIIQAKVDAIITVQTALNSLAVGDTIETTTAKGEVVYLYPDGNGYIIYMNNITGVWDPTGFITISNTIDIGNYVYVTPDSSHPELGGYWMIPIGSSVLFRDVIVDNSPGLIIKDIRQAGYAGSYDTYYSIGEDLGVKGTIVDGNDKISLVGRFDQSDDATVVNSKDVSSKWFIRLGPTAPNYTLPGTTIRLQENTFLQTQPWESLGLLGQDTQPFFNGEHIITEFVDGYLKVQIQTDAVGTHSFQEGDQLEDANTGAIYYVWYADWDAGFQTQTLFVNVVSGTTFSTGSDFGDSTRIIRKRSGVVDRDAGFLVEASVYTPTNDISKLIIFDARNLPGNDPVFELPILEVFFIENYEYWIVPQTRTETGAGRPANEPLANNSDWTRTNSIPVTSSGGTLFTGQGYISVYERLEENAYILDSRFVIPLTDSNGNTFDAIGANLEFRNFDGLYILYVNASDKVIFVKKGTEGLKTYDWEVSLDKDYRNTWNTSDNYFIGDIVTYPLNSNLYRANTNVTAGNPFNFTQWDLVTNDIDYTGYIPKPNTAGSDIKIAGGFDDFGNDYAISQDGKVLAAYVQRDDSTVNVDEEDTIAIYRYSNNSYRLNEEIAIIDASVNDGEYKHSFALSDDGTQIAIGLHQEDAKGTLNNGRVKVYKYASGTWALTNTITSPQITSGEKFGKQVKFIGNNLLISSLYGDRLIERPFTDGTYFDNGFTKFSELKTDIGILYIFENLNDNFMYAGILDDQLDISKDFKINQHHLYSKVGTTIVNYKWNGINNWFKHRESLPIVDVSKFKNPFMYDKSTNTFIDYIDIIDPVQGKIAGPAEQELRYKSSWDPAIYTNVGENDSVTVDAFKSWGPDQVGQLWWDISTAMFKNAYQGTPLYQTNTWNKQFAGSSIDVYEWVESSLSPAQWREDADTESGIADGISGTPKYSDDTYVLKKKYNSTLQSFSNLYYFWVKNKKTIPNKEERQTTAYDVAQYISDPRAFGYKYVELQSQNNYVINNSLQSIKHRDTVINFTTWTIPNQQLNIHNQYQIISDGLYTSQPSEHLKTKWFDSLVGYDKNLKQVPDPELSPKLRYGNRSRPRQTWFVNRLEALKTVIERSNFALSKQIIIDDFDLSKLNTKDDAPSMFSQEYDYIVDNEIDLQFIGTNKFRQAILTPVLTNGRLTDVIIVDPGQGYIDLSYTSGVRKGPTIKVVGTGSAASVECTINSQGRIIGTTIVSPGSGYNDRTTLEVRGLTALVESDSTISNKWSLMQYNTITQEWDRKETQNFDTTLYWKYIDWYADGYNQFTDATYTLEYAYELESLDDAIGDIVKINKTSDNTWLLLEKVDDVDSVDYSVNYNTVGRENGTIEIDKGLYDFTDTISGYDGYAFDTAIYDGVPIVETRNILETLFDNIFVDNLAIEYNKIFFASIRYILSEGQKPDWLFKTSFVKVKHNFGELEQRVNYQNDNLPNYQDYIAEVKPYKTKIREFVSSYSKLDNTKSRVTDFDLFPWYDSSTGKITPKTAVIENGKIIAKDSDTYPWKSWFDNATYYLDEIKIASGGTKYKSAPVLTIEGGGGTGATAVAYISRGTITSVDITNPGVGYTSAPRIVINGNQDEDGVPAELVAIIKNDTIRKINTTIKFDRVSGKLQYIDLDRTETFLSLAQQTEFTLKWPLDIDSLKIDITIDGEEALISEYEYANVVDKTFTDYTVYKGKVTFASGIAGDSTVVINYRIDPAMLSAGDRIHNLYKPVSGMPGYDTTIQDLSQVMDGIDYGGVEITSFDFDTDAGWDASGWYTDSWDEYDGTYEDIIIVGDGSTRRITLDTPLETGVTYNLYVNGTRIDDPNYGTPQATNTNALTASYVGDGITLEYDVSNFNIGDGDIFILRKETSDGTFLPDLTSFDTQLSGGNFAYGNAGGHDAGEIIVDGDGFVTVTSSRSTEEHVPGQVLDTVDIKVFDRTGDGQGIIVTRTHTFNADAEYAALAARQAEKASLEANVLAQDSTLDSLQTQLVTLEAEKVVLEQELVTLEATRDANDLTQSAYTSLLAQISDYTNQIAVKQSELSNLQSEKSSKDGEIASLQSQLSSIGGQISSLDTQISSLSSQLTTAQDELLSLQQQLSSLQNDLTNYLPSDPEYSQIQSQITQVQSQISSKQSQISSLQSQLNSLQSQRSSLLGQQNTLQSQLSAAQSESDSLAGQITTVNSEIITLQNDRTIVENQRDAYELAYNGYVADVSSKQNDISNKQSEIDVKQSQIDNQTTIILNVNNAIIAKQVEIDNAQAAIDALNVPFDIGATPIKAENLIVRATGGSLVTKNRIVGPEDYTIDYVNKTILFNNALDTGTTITTMVVGTNGSRILDTGTFTGDGSTAQFLTKVQHKENLTAFVSVDGEKRSALAAEGVVPDVEIVKSTSEYAYDGTVIFEFGEAPPDGSLINYTLYDSDTQSFSEITIDEFTADGSTTNFTLSQIPFTGLPLDVNILVIDNNNVLHTGYKRKFTAQETNFYPLSTWHVPYQSQSANDIAVYINGVLKTNTLEYRWYPETSTLELFNDFYKIGDTIEIYTKNNSYELVGDEIRLVNVPTNGKVLVYQFSEHDTLGIERTTVNSIKRSTLVVGSDDWKAYAESSLGIIRLGSSVLSENYVWLALNGELLSPTIDYSLREDFESLQIHRDIKDGDTIDVIHYTSPVSSRRFGYRQFKDILNRTHYKRINSLTETILDKDLNYTDLRIHVLDGSILDEPNKSANLPGIIFINGERIEYFVKEGNVLRQIRRGTLGTGVNTFVKAGTTVSNQGAVESIPYQDKTIINEFVGNGTDTDFTLPFSAQYGVDQFEVFVAGKRLRKAPLQKFNHLLDQTSPQADETLPAEFSVHGTDDNTLRLLVAPETGQQIKVIRKIGTQWRQEGVSLKDSKTAISSFLRESTTKLPE